MKKLPLLAALAAVLAAPAIAATTMPKVDVLAKDAHGRATQVSVDGKVYDVCLNEQQDECIQPRAIGLKWGDRPLAYWPGKSTDANG